MGGGSLANGPANPLAVEFGFEVMHSRPVKSEPDPIMVGSLSDHESGSDKRDVTSIKLKIKLG